MKIKKRLLWPSSGKLFLILFAILSVSGGCSSSSESGKGLSPRGTYDPSSGCQQALSHIITLSIKGTGEGPSNQQREQFLSKCIATGSDRGSYCVLRLKRLERKSGEGMEMRPVWACLSLR